MTQTTKTTDGALHSIYRETPIVWLKNGRFQWDIMGGTTYATVGEAHEAIDNWLKSTERT